MDDADHRIVKARCAMKLSLFAKSFLILIFLHAYGWAQGLTIPLDSKTSYLRVDDDSGCQQLNIPCGAGNAAAISLHTLGISPGDSMQLQEVGSFVPGLPPFDADSATQLCGVFSSNSQLLSSDSLHRVPGAIPAGPPACNQFPTSLFSGTPIDIPQDFSISTSGTTIVVPAGAQYLFVAPPDSFYSDNSDPNHDFGVRISGANVRPHFAVANVSATSGIANQNVQTTGIQWIDYNKDRRLDLFLVGSNGTALFKNVGGGKFVDVTVAAHIGNNGRNANGASWADIDNDGDPDVFIANASGAPTLLLNNNGVFSDISGKLNPGIVTSDQGSLKAGIWLDINNDKDIELLVVKSGAPNQLIKKQGLDFKDIASSAGLAVTSTGRSAIASDFNADGFVDLYIINFMQPNKLYLNNGNETFQDITATAGVGLVAASVQAAVADYDRDQDMDIFVVNNEGSCVLYRNLGNLKFKNVTPGVLKNPKKGIAAAFADVDSDGNQDLILAQTQGGNLLFQNLGKGNFKIVTGIDLSNPDNPTGITIGDFNGDGLPDIAIGDGDSSSDHGDSLYQNTGGGGNNSITFTLVGTSSNKSAIGARVIVQTGLTFQAKEVTSGDGKNQQSLPLEFGVGVANLVDTVRIYWPDQNVQTIQNLKVNTRLTITEKP